MSMFSIVHISPRGRREMYVLAYSTEMAWDWAYNRYGEGKIQVTPVRRKA